MTALLPEGAGGNGLESEAVPVLSILWDVSASMAAPQGVPVRPASGILNAERTHL